jgi:putative hydrolase of the HAD superfamily
MLIKAVIFDIGGVLIRTEDLEPRRKWERRFGLPDWGLSKVVWDDNPVSHAATVGRASLAAVWADVGRALALSAAELAELRADFFRGDKLDEALIAYIRSLRPRYRTGIISNAWPGAREELRGRINGETFDAILFSAEEGLKKPDPELYRRALARLNVQPGEAVFVDDFSENVEAARALGLAGVHFTRGMGAAEVRAEFEKLGIR